MGQLVPGEEAAAAVGEYGCLHSDSETGQVQFRQWPKAVKGHFMARIPALGGEG